MMPTRHPLSLLPLLLPVLLAAAPAAAQAPGFSTDDWRRVETGHFLFLYPAEAEAWTLPIAARMEAVRASVLDLVGFAPEDRVTVVVNDPGNVANGSMWPGPLLILYPTPPNPTSVIGDHRGWGEFLAVHEFAHAAHLTRPSRNPIERLRYSLLPVPVTRIMSNTPRWAVEGYATYVEGRLTGTGRPRNAWRPGILRTWALDGQLPSYGQMSGSSGFFGGSLAYLMGSAYLEWLVAREGGDETVLPDVWARFTARQKRGFDGAFAGVFGAPPAELYGLFTVDVTEAALAVRDAVEAAGGVVEGELFQRLSWNTGAPAVSPDGERLAVVVRGRETPSRVVVMATTPDTLPTRVRERQAEIFARDPEDVPPVERRPRAQRHQATLWPTAGASYEAPAWMPDGTGILLVRADLAENEQVRPDLFLWRWEEGDVRRITRGAAIREADPSPDGTWAAGLRCLNARCDIVRIDLADGDVTVLAPGGHESPWYRPRVSPDGSRIAASRQVDGRWRLAVMDADGTDARFVDPDDGATRFDADWLPDGSALVLTSSLGGIHNLERLDPETGETAPLTRVLGAALAPTPMPDGEVFFNALHSRGWDLRRIRPDDAPATVVHVDPALAPAAPAGVVPADTFPVAPIGPVRGYGLGPRFRSWVPMGTVASRAYAAGLAIHGTDPIGMFTWQLRGMYGEEDAFRGGALDAVYRGWPADLRVGAFAVGGPVPAAAGDALLDEAYYGGLASLTLRRARVGVTREAELGGSWGLVPGDDASRELGWLSLRSARLRTPGTLRITRSMTLHGALGRTAGEEWTRWLAGAAIGIGRQDRTLLLSGRFGRVDAPAGSTEDFAVGGLEPVLLDPGLISQRIAMPALPVGFLRGHEVWTGRAEIRNGLGGLFYWIGDAAGDAIDRQQVLGIDVAADFPAVHWVRLPASRISLGIARLLDEPLQNEWRAWAGVGFGVE